MKRFVVLVMVLILTLGLMGCGKSEELKAAEKAIESIGNVSLESKDLIDEAQNKVDALTEEDLNKISNLGVLKEAQNKYAALVITDLIDKLNVGSLADQSAVVSARKAYEDATDDIKEMISNYSLLENAEQRVEELKEEAKREQEEAKRREEQAKAENVIGLITKIGEVSLSSKEVIDDARSEYDKLSEETKKLVTNYTSLTEAEKAYSVALENAYNAALSRMNIKKDEVNRTTFYLPKRIPTYINTRCILSAYIGVQGSSIWLHLYYNYAGDDWVFFEKITIAADDARYNKSFNYFDVTRDNGGGMVGECADVVAGESDIKMLKAICAASRTIVRFEGDDWYYDYTLNDKDRAAIEDALIVYEYLKNK